MSGTSETLTFRPRHQQWTETLALRRAHDDRMDRAARRRQQIAQRHSATVARRHGIAHRMPRRSTPAATPTRPTSPATTA